MEKKYMLNKGSKNGNQKINIIRLSKIQDPILLCLWESYFD